MTFVNGVNLLPSTGEWTYDIIPHLGRRVSEPNLLPLNLFYSPTGTKTDFDYAIDQLQANFPACETVALVVSWFGNSLDAAACDIYPSTTYIGGAFRIWSGASYEADHWLCSGLTEASPELIPISSSGGSFSYGGTPSDQSIVRCIQSLKARGFRVVFYPFILMDAAGFPWRGRITFSPDKSSAAANAVNAFLGSASPVQFTRDAVNLTVGYAGLASDWSFRRMILHYANLCVIAGGVDLFLLGSELRGLETIRGPSWTKAGVMSDGFATWDYPFVDGIIALSDDVRSIFDTASLTKDLAGRRNLLAYAADWSAWMGIQHPGENGQWPHLDQLYAHSNIDLICFDNYLPLSDWTTGDGGVDVKNWAADAPSTWPAGAPDTIGFGLSGNPSIHNKRYLKANIEGGEKFYWYYGNSNNMGRRLDPNGSDLRVSCPDGDRLTQSRQAYFPNQEILGNKQIRWWWNNRHYAVYDTGSGWTPQGAPTRWAARSKSIAFTEYGFPSCDRATNQPNVFFDAKSSESATPFWSVWDPADGGRFLPRRDQTLALLALQAIYEYWFADGHNEMSADGISMIERAFCSVWNWDARPFPVFPNLTSVWGDAGNWQAGNWLGGKGPFIAPPVPEINSSPGAYPSFPSLTGLGWGIRYAPRFETETAGHVSGRESRRARVATPVWEIEISFDLLRMSAPYAELETVLGFTAEAKRQNTPFMFPAPPEIGSGPSLVCRFLDDRQDAEEFMERLWRMQSVKLRSLKGE